MRRGIEDEKFECSWKFYNRMTFMKEDVVRSLTKEAVKEQREEEINTLIELYENDPVLQDYPSKDYSDRNLRKLAMENIKETLGDKTEEKKTRVQEKVWQSHI